VSNCGAALLLEGRRLEGGCTCPFLLDALGSNRVAGCWRVATHVLQVHLLASYWYSVAYFLLVSMRQLRSLFLCAFVTIKFVVLVVAPTVRRSTHQARSWTRQNEQLLNKLHAGPPHQMI
jgi:hypothetical protein